MKARNVALNLNTKVHTRLGIASFAVGIISLILVIIAVYISVVNEYSIRMNQYIIGLLEVLAIILSISGLGLGIAGETTVETYKKYAHIGVSINSILIVFHVVILLAAA